MNESGGGGAAAAGQQQQQQQEEEFSDTLISSFEHVDAREKKNWPRKRKQNFAGPRGGQDVPSRKVTKRQAAKNKGKAASSNGRMHPRNRYFNNPPDFAELARQDADLRSVLLPQRMPACAAAGTATPGDCEGTAEPSRMVNFDHPLATYFLSRALLKRDFGITFSMPPNRLCPGVSGRLNYIHWIEDLLEISTTTAPAAAVIGSRLHDGHGTAALEVATETQREIRGMDIGTGASCIYPLLGCRLHPDWSFIATDIDDTSLESAMQNVDTNNLESRVELRQASPHTWIVGNLTAALMTEEEAASSGNAGGIEDVNEWGANDSSSMSVADSIGCPSGQAKPLLDFCMCNPPFFSSSMEAAQRRRPGCAGVEHELIYERSDIPPSTRATIADVAALANIDVAEDAALGGEVLFVLGIMRDSLKLRERVTWYTSLLGKKSSLKVLTRVLRAAKATAVFTTEFMQGRTSRWGLAWSFSCDGSKIPMRQRRLVTSSLHTAVVTSSSNNNNNNNNSSNSGSRGEGKHVESRSSAHGGEKVVQRVFSLPGDGLPVEEFERRVVEVFEQYGGGSRTGLGSRPFVDLRHVAPGARFHQPETGLPASRSDATTTLALTASRFFLDLPATGQNLRGFQGSYGVPLFGFKVFGVPSSSTPSEGKARSSDADESVVLPPLLRRCVVRLALPVASFAAFVQMCSVSNNTTSTSNIYPASEAALHAASPETAEVNLLLDEVQEGDLPSLKTTKTTSLSLKLFWEFVDLLQNDVCRTSRKWRRFYKKQNRRSEPESGGATSSP